MKKQKIHWNVDDWVPNFFCTTAIGPPLIVPIEMRNTLYTKKKGTKMKKQKIYWNADEGQIMTKDGECIYDKGYIAKLREIANSNIEKDNKFVLESQPCLRALQGKMDGLYRSKDKRLNHLHSEVGKFGNKLAKNENEIETLKAQLQCSAKGHGKWAYVNCAYIGGVCARNYIFKCSVCDLEITKMTNELTPTEKGALTKLGILNI